MERAPLLEEAMSFYKKEVDREPLFAAAWNNLGWALTDKALLQNSKEAKNGLFLEAYPNFERTLAIEPFNVDALNNIGWIDLNRAIDAVTLTEKMHLLDGAEARLKLAIALDPDYERSTQNLSLVAKLRVAFN
ncbi:MAG: hypothetical protein H7232_13870 [Aeromicrobium sp.]|nr:hypothetical protein [Burkholderiales bacterium]